MAALAQFNPPNAYTFDQGFGVDIENTAREKAALMVHQLIVWIDISRARCLSWMVQPAWAAYPHPRRGFDQGVAALLASAPMSHNATRYTCRLLEYYIRVVFVKNSLQSKQMLEGQIISAITTAVESEDEGGLKPVLRQWDLDLTLMEWGDEAASLWTPVQLGYCFRVCVRFYRVNVEADRFATDVYHYPVGEDTHGLSLFDGNPYIFRNCLVLVFARFTCSVQSQLRRLRTASLLEHRSGGDGGVGGDGGGGDRKRRGGWTAWAYYLFSGALLKIAKDGRFFTTAPKSRSFWLEGWKVEGHIADPMDLHIAHQSFLPIAKEIQAKLCAAMRTLQDVTAGLQKSALKGAVAEAVGAKFAKLVLRHAPCGLVWTRKKVHPDAETSEADAALLLSKVVQQLWNTRSKMMRNADVEQQRQSLRQSFRPDLASKAEGQTDQSFDLISMEVL